MLELQFFKQAQIQSGRALACFHMAASQVRLPHVRPSRLVGSGAIGGRKSTSMARQKDRSDPMATTKPLVLVTGSAGYIGTALVRALTSEYRVVGLDREPGPRSFIRADFV